MNLEKSDPEQSGKESAVQPNITKEQKILYKIFVAQGIELALVCAEKVCRLASNDMDAAAEARRNLKSFNNPTPIKIAYTIFDIMFRIERDAAEYGIRFDLAVKLKGCESILKALLSMSGLQLNEQQHNQIRENIKQKIIARSQRDSGTNCESSTAPADALADLAKRLKLKAERTLKRYCIVLPAKDLFDDVKV